MFLGTKAYLCRKVKDMTFEEALAFCDRLKEYIIGSEIKDIRIESLFLAPTDWGSMSDYMNIQLQKGSDEAVSAFIGKSFSVYGVHTDKSMGIPRTTLVNLDSLDTAMNN